MSTAASASASSGSPQAAARAHVAGARKPAQAPTGQEPGADLFANLINLLSATTDLPPDGSLLAEAAPDDAAANDATNNPLAALMGWPGAPTLLASAPASPGASGSLATGVGPMGAASSSPKDGTPLAQPLVAPATTTGASGEALNGATPPSTDPLGLQPLDQPVSPDEKTLAALARGPANGTTDPATPANAASAAAGGRPTSWRSTVTTATTSSVQQLLAHQSASERIQVRVESGAPLALRSTVMLDERFAPSSMQTDSAPATTGLGVHAADPSPGANAGGQPGAHGDSGQDGATPSPASESDAFKDASNELEAQAGLDGEEALEAWTSTPLRQASLRVGEDGEEAIDIQLSMTGQELNLEFRTDSAQAREELARNADESLAERLQRSGIQLGEVSVGAQSRQQERESRESGGRSSAVSGSTGAGRARNAPEAAASSAAALPRPPRADGSRPLDLFV